MTTKRALLVSIIIFAGVSLVGAQSPGPPPGSSPEASASPAKKVRKKKAAPPAGTPAASASPASPLSKIGPLFKPKPTASPGATTTTRSAETNATPAPGGGHGLVWVNTESHIYHKEGSRFYGKTKQGKYMSEAEATKEGDRAAKTGD